MCESLMPIGVGLFYFLTFKLMFDENKLREEIARVRGQHGAHMEVYDMLLKRA